ncbi:MAG: cytochrome B [Gallionellales bacterium RIFCSPLOWO2_02_60_31]|nr:MAG: cytochrome B [Gallionellales bacterium RIFCSPLOWO2_02_60_31]
MSQPDARAKAFRSILVWDVPTRVFHWLLVLSFTGAYLTAESELDRDIHVVLGYTLLGLLVFRLLWGFFGTRYARFRSFLFKPGEIVAYSLSLLKGKPAHYIGHNPLGSVSVWLLLGLGLLSGVSGVMTFQDIGGDILEEMHEFVSDAMLAVVLIHIAGVVVSSLLHRENLVRAMVTGFKYAEPEQGIRRSYLWLGVIMLVVVVAFWVVYPAIALATPSAETVQVKHHDDD